MTLFWLDSEATLVDLAPRQTQRRSPTSLFIMASGMSPKKRPEPSEAHRGLGPIAARPSGVPGTSDYEKNAKGTNAFNGGYHEVLLVLCPNLWMRILGRYA